ncbi:MAG: ComF family protein, partial [Candidatus Curtissbacteria bacterium]|nr:ComF family protein [Candidatus Curtissbacteria bacterium]
LDLVFPKRCVGCRRVGPYICADCVGKIEFVEKPVCPICQRQAIGGKTHPGCSGKYRLDGLIVAARYRGPVKTAIQKVKYKWVFDIEKILVDLVSKQLWKFDFPQEAILTAVPLHIKRKRWRGFNQSEILAKTLAKKFKVKYGDFLVRKIETKTQVGLSREDRKKNIRDAFALSLSRQTNPSARHSYSSSRHPELVSGSNIILVDDVYTSGATMGECAKVLKKAGAKSVWGMVVALG